MCAPELMSSEHVCPIFWLRPRLLCMLLLPLLPLALLLRLLPLDACIGHVSHHLQAAEYTAHARGTSSTTRAITCSCARSASGEKSLCGTAAAVPIVATIGFVFL